LPSDALIGLAVASHQRGTLAIAHFDQDGGAIRLVFAPMRGPQTVAIPALSRDLISACRR
jgi:hypothetical protein